MSFTKEFLVQETVTGYLSSELGWDSSYAHNNEDYGPNSLLGRSSDHEVVLTRILREKLAALNPDLPDSAYEDALGKITSFSASQSILSTNREKYELLKDGVQVTFFDRKNERIRKFLKVLDYDHPENNHFLCVRELWIKGDL